jgi:hypothetical protein
MKTGTFVRVAVVAMAMTFAVSMASAQALNSTAQPISLNATLAESLTVTLSSSSVNFNLTAGSANNPGLSGVTATTKWALSTGRSSVGVYAYFGSTTALTDGAGDNIPTSAFTISDNGGAAAPVTGSVVFGAAGAGLQLANVTLSAGANNYSGTRNDAMTFNINLSGGTLPSLPAATYTGTLNIQAQAL